MFGKENCIITIIREVASPNEIEDRIFQNVPESIC
jgi:hypothetical protein